MRPNPGYQLRLSRCDHLIIPFRRTYFRHYPQPRGRPATGTLALHYVDKSSTIVDVMSTKDIASSLLPRTRRLLLTELVRSAAPIHLRELARRTGLDPSGVQRELKNLVSSGIVIEKSAGNQKEYSLNVNCPIHPDLRMLIIKTTGLADHLRSALEAFKGKIILAYIYGSFADGTADAGSDVDVMIVGDIGLRTLAHPLAVVARELCREINPVTYKPSEYESELKTKGSFIYRIHNGPRIILIGESNESR